MKKLLTSALIFSIFFLFAPLALAAVAFHHSGGTTAATVTSASWSHTGTGDNYLIVGLALRSGSTFATGVSCTAMGAAMGTALGTSVVNALSQNFTFGLSSSTLGIGTISCSWTNSENVAAVSNSFSGVSSIGTPQSVSGNGPGYFNNAITATIGSNDMLWQGISCDSTPTTAFGTQSGTATTSAQAGSGIGFEGAEITGSGSVTNNAGAFGCDEVGGVGVPLTGAAAAATPTPILYLIRAFWW